MKNVKENKTLELVASLAVGLLFAAGLGLSGMTRPEKVIGFLDVSSGKWDPALAFVMGGAVTVYAIGFRLITRRARPLATAKFSLPTRKDIDFRLVAGATLFGAGWGLGGYCPGPALTSLTTGSASVFTFVAAMLTGMFLFTAYDRARGSAKNKTTDKATLAPTIAFPNKLEKNN